MKLTARRPMTYNTRRLQAGDSFEANERVGNLLVKLKRAQKDPAAEETVGDSIPTSLSRGERVLTGAAEGLAAIAPVQVGEAPAAPVAKTEFKHVINEDNAQIEVLRMQAERLGINVDRRWGVKRLQIEIAARA